MSGSGFRQSFGIRIFRAFASAGACITIAITSVLVMSQSRTVKEHLINEGYMLSQLLSESSKTWVFAENREFLKETASGVVAQEHVIGLVIYNAQRKAIYSDFKAEKSIPDIDKAREAMPEGVSPSVSPEYTEGSESLDFYAPVLLKAQVWSDEIPYFEGAVTEGKPQVIGYVRVILDKHVLHREVRGIVIRSIFFAAVLLAAGGLVIYFVIRRVTRPLTELTESVRGFGIGAPFTPVHVEAADEIGRLARAFNTMSENLIRREEEKKALEEELLQAKKMEALGRFARGISHDFNNILGAVRGSIYYVARKLPSDSPLRTQTDRINSSIERAKVLIESLIAFSRLHNIEKSVVDINGLIRRTCPFISGMMGEKVELRTGPMEEALPVMADAVQIEQVVMNLCVNARDSMPEGGVVSVGASMVEGTGETEASFAERGMSHFRFTPSESRRLSGRMAEIYVDDCGMGMDDPTAERMFEPFFTTKTVGRGTGLGLAIVYGIVEQHGGMIDVYTKKGEGTHIRVYFPAENGNSH